eukprot:Partr_v1_DN25787_c0_g1_i1_m74524 putative Uncharacterised protein domain (DUF2415)
MTITNSGSLSSNGLLSMENDLYVKPAARKHAQRSSIQHWQLRDLINCPEKRSEFYHVHQNNVFMYNTVTAQPLAIMKELTFAPTSMTTGCGYLAVGGQRHQLMVRQLNSSWFAQTSVGGSINNALCIARHPHTTDSQNSDVRLLVCNNDESIKVYNLPSLQRITTIGLTTAVNYASVSPDGRKMCAVGDSNQVFIYDVSPSGFYQRLATLTATNDAGFSCSWNHSSDKLAVATQDGYVSVWDMRYIHSSQSNSQTAPSSTSRAFPGSRSSAMSSITSPALSQSSASSFLSRDSTKLAVIPSTQHPHVKGAVRAVKFAPSPGMDLLAFTEHVSYLNIVDARTFDPANRQSIRVGPPGNDVHLSGFAFSPDSRTIFAGTESAVFEYDIDTISRRSFPVGALI